MSLAESISAAVKRAALDAGFELAGIAPVRDFPELGHFEQWIAAGHAGEMKYMEARNESGKLKRVSLRSAVPWARSVIVCAINYNTRKPYSTEPHAPGQGWISRYAWSREDYHDAVMRRLRVVEERLRSAFVGPGAEDLPSQGSAQLGSAGTGPFDSAQDKLHPVPTHSMPGAALQTRCYVDTGPVVERVYAKYAGVGWVGKNTCILNQQQGSWVFLGVILTSLKLAADLPAPDRCGSCTRCIDACPTDAFIAPYQLDSNRCISYLTIEKRGAIAEELREGMGRHIFGCDICQDVCPWNRKAPATGAEEFQPREGLVNPALEWLAQISEEEFREKFRGSPVRRAKRSGLRRNAAIAMGNSGERRFVAALEKLSADEDETVASSAEWALFRLQSS